MNFSNKLKELRRARGISQAELADALHFSRSAVAKWENGLGMPSKESLSILADYLAVSKDELVTVGEDGGNKNKTSDKDKKL
jgi:transcriptional regulator with XRE-family HTH domain